jgi:hypothetical protein
MTFRSSISMLRWLKACIYRASQQFIFVTLLHGFNNSSVSSAVPYSCLLFSMCNTYAEIGLLVFMYLLCSLCCGVIYLPDCPTYA